MKTALQELIEQLETKLLLFGDYDDALLSERGQINELVNCIALVKSKLEKERQDLINAFDKGKHSGLAYARSDKNTLTAEEYFIKKFKQ